jgi:hypothetical protein
VILLFTKENGSFPGYQGTLMAVSDTNNNVGSVDNHEGLNDRRRRKNKRQSDHNLNAQK